MNDDLLSLTPVQSYAAPAIPTLSDTRANPALLKKLPSRWQKNAAVITCIGLAGTLTLSACANLGRPYAGAEGETTSYVTQITEQETSSEIFESTTEQETLSYTYATTTAGATERSANPVTTTQQQVTVGSIVVRGTELELRVHHGGGGGAPTYIVHLTEQEAFGIIQAQLEAAGLRFGATPPNVTVLEDWHFGPSIGLDLYDRQRRVAISFISWETNHQPFFSWGGSRLAEQVSEEFAQHRQLRNTAVGVFYNPGETVGWGEMPWGDEWEAKMPTLEDKQAAIPKLRANLNEQAQAFIAFLQEEGIL